MSGDDDDIIIHHNAATLRIPPGHPLRQPLLDALYRGEGSSTEDDSDG